MKTSIQILYDNGLFDNKDSADEVINDIFSVERRRLDLEEVNDLIQGFYLKKLFKK